MGAKPKVIKEVKALVPNLTLIEVRHPFWHFSLAESVGSRRKSLLSLCQRYSKRVYPRKTRRRSKRLSRRMVPSSSSTRHHIYSLPFTPSIHGLTGAVLTFRLYLITTPVPTTVVNAHTMLLIIVCATNTHMVDKNRPKNVHKR